MQIAFSSYTLIGLTLLVLAGSAAVYLSHLAHKSKATWTLIIFLSMIALSGTATILTNALVLWSRFFAPWQDFWILAGGVALTLFAYYIAAESFSTEGRVALITMGGIALIALSYCLIFSYRFYFQWTPQLDVHEGYYLLLPLSTLLMILILLRRARHFSQCAGAAAQPPLIRSATSHLVHPRGAEARTLRNLALALSLAFLPGLQTFISFPNPYGFILSNIGSILAIVAITLVYFNYAPEVSSFMANLVGITLATVLSLLTLFGTIDLFLEASHYRTMSPQPMTIEAYLSPIAFNWLLVLLVSSALILLLFPQLFRRILVTPLNNLLDGIRQVNAGDLDTAVPVTSQDEIGFLTQSFNELTRSLKTSQHRQHELYVELQRSHRELEHRVTERTQELAAFTDLSRISSDLDNLPDSIQPVLSRIIELNLCQAVAVHLLTGEELELVAQRALPAELARATAPIRGTERFLARVQHGDEALILNTDDEPGPLPPGLQVAGYPTYLGCSLTAGDQSHGWLSCYRAPGEPFTPGERSLLLALARQMGVIAENHQLRLRLKETAVTLERRRLARDLHDSVTQMLYSQSLFTRSAQEAMEDGDQERLHSSLDQLAQTALLALREMRYLLFQLQPPAIEESGFTKALDARLDMVERRIGIQVKYRIDHAFPFAGQWEQELYYVVVEALNNALKHAQADQVEISLGQENGFGLLVVADNGRGFDMDRVSPGMGLSSMRQRVEALGGELAIDSALKSGTKITARVPFAG